MELKELLMFMTKKGASDLHIKSMRPPLLRIQGRLIPVKSTPLKPDEVEEMMYSILSPVQKANFEKNLSVDIGYGIPGVARFRCNFFMQRGTMAAVFRRVPFEIQKVADLNLPDVIETFTDYPGGMVLVTGPTGSGKSTTLAALIQKIANTRSCHVVTIEDPIEFLFSDDKATISQREVGTDTPTFKEALRNCVRQDPDVIMVGEMRDLETMSTAITAAETGHLVFSTLHTNNAAQTIDRIIDSYPVDQQHQVRSQLALVLRSIVSMQLINRAEGDGRLPVVEILVNSPKISKHIEAGEIKEISEEMENSVNYYRMQSMNQSLIALLAHNQITYEQAVGASLEPDDLSLKLRKMFPSIEERFREGEMAPSPADFSEITGLLETKRLYEEAEDRHRQKIAERDEVIRDLERELAELRTQAEDASSGVEALRREADQSKAEVARVREESQAKINALNERIRDLNQQLTGNGKGQGFFKR
ncbi:MAG TPA: PilT/PilU family type 4a pilus ATPase [Candidatus Sulfomarinibacteraceae bacterium]|nr:PilT/PilU family type 4a pilus ATPase [Candidatus Sulfomarinibacteraceae bacterium]